MCLVVFQKIFWKIFSGVWKRRRKTQIQKNTSHNPDPVRRQIQSDDRAVDRDRRRDLAKRRSRSRIFLSRISRSRLREIVPSIAISIRCDLAKARSRSTARSRDGEIAINGDWNVCRRDRDRRGLELGVRRRSSDCAGSRARARSLSLCKIFQKYFEGKIEV